LREAQALVKQREFEYQAQQNLLKKGYQAEVNLSETLALLESAKAQVEYARIELEQTLIRAPFDGTLVERMVEKGDYLSKGNPIAIVSDDNPLIFVGEITEIERFQVHTGMPATVQLVTGRVLNGKIRFVAVNAEATTRTFTIEVEVPNLKGDIPAGVTCEIRIPVETIFAHKVSAALLSLSDEGILGLKTVDTDQRVKFYPVQFARATTEAVWLKGLPERVQLITVGQGFVREGQKVQVINDH
jgi:multidrug efflux system membrane fusion protein